MLHLRFFLTTALVFTSVPAWAADKEAWPSANFIARNKMLCPRMDLSDLTDGSFSTEAFQALAWLSPRSASIVDTQIKAECADELGGFYCESAVIVRNLDKARLTDRFVAHLCRKYRACPEPAAC